MPRGAGCLRWWGACGHGTALTRQPDGVLCSSVVEPCGTSRSDGLDGCVQGLHDRHLDQWSVGDGGEPAGAGRHSVSSGRSRRGGAGGRPGGYPPPWSRSACPRSWPAPPASSCPVARSCWQPCRRRFIGAAGRAHRQRHRVRRTRRLPVLPGIRRRRTGWHRAARRLLVLVGLVVALSALWLTLFFPRTAGGDLLFVFRLLAGSGLPRASSSASSPSGGATSPGTGRG